MLARHAAWLACCGLAAAQALASGLGGSSWLQPADGDSGLAIEVAERTARAWSEGGSVRALRLREGERLAMVEEVADGWVAAGTRSRGGSQELLLMAGGAGPTRRLEPPAAAPGASWRSRPALLAEAGRLVGLAWLEGSSRSPLAVRVAERDTDEWEVPTTVAWPTSGSQSGLTGAVLPDGTWLLVWARFDGQDDELVWSARRGAGWSPPAPVADDNAIPDVTPALFPLADGALVAWSRLVDGEYWVLVAHTEADGWSAPRAVSGPGGVYPAFAGRDGTPFLLVRSAFPGGWLVLELDLSGEPVRRAVVAAVDPGRPALHLQAGQPAALRLPSSGGSEPLAWETTP